MEIRGNFWRLGVVLMCGLLWQPGAAAFPSLSKKYLVPALVVAVTGGVAGGLLTKRVVHLRKQARALKVRLRQLRSQDDALRSASVQQRINEIELRASEMARVQQHIMHLKRQRRSATFGAGGGYGALLVGLLAIPFMAQREKIEELADQNKEFRMRELDRKEQDFGIVKSRTQVAVMRSPKAETDFEKAAAAGIGISTDLIDLALCNVRLERAVLNKQPTQELMTAREALIAKAAQELAMLRKAADTALAKYAEIADTTMAAAPHLEESNVLRQQYHKLMKLFEQAAQANPLQP